MAKYSDEIYKAEKRILEECPGLMMDTTKIDSNLGLRQFMKELINDYLRNNLTLTLDGKIQCVPDRHRSTEDIFRIVRHYKPEVYLGEVIYELVDLFLNEEIHELWCPTIGKITWWSHLTGRENTYDEPYLVIPKDVDKKPFVIFSPGNNTVDTTGLNLLQYIEYYNDKKRNKDRVQDTNTFSSSITRTLTEKVAVTTI